MDKEEFVKSLGIRGAGAEGEAGYVVTFADSNAYADAYSRLSSSSEVELDPEYGTASEHGSEMRYVSDDFELTLKADFDRDAYSLVVTEA